MKALKRYGAAALSAVKAPRFAPDYNDEVSERYLDKLREEIDEKKPKGFSLTPVCEPGW